MAAFHGKEGKVVFDSGTMSNVTAWSIDAICDVVDTTVMDSTTVTSATHWKDHTAAWNDWTATFDVILDDSGYDPNFDGDFATDADGLAIVFTTKSGGGAYNGNSIITNISTSLDIGDVAKVTYSIQGSGPLTYA